MDTVWVLLYSLLLFISMTVSTGRMSLILAGLAQAACLPIGKAPLRNLRQRLCVPVLGLLAFALMNGLAALYSNFGGTARSEFYKIFAALSMALILLARFEKKHARGLLWGFAAICGVISLLCVDHACGGPLFQVFQGVMQACGAGYENLEQAEWAIRIIGIYNDANVSGSLLALGALVSLYLMGTEGPVKGKLPACVLLGASAMGFFLSMSRGAMICFGLTLLVWVILEPREGRLVLLLRIIFTAVVTAVCGALAMRALTAGAFLPQLLTLLAGLPLFLLDRLLVRSAAFLGAHLKVARICMAVLVLAAASYGVAALTVTGPYALRPGDAFNRTVELTPGEHTFSGDWDETVLVRVVVQVVDEEGQAGTRAIYDGPVTDAVFSVAPGESVILRIYSDAGGEIRALTASGGTEIPLNYRLLPVFLAERLQADLFSSSSFSMRLQYDKDAWTLFTQSPLIGHGLSSTENLYTSVQPFYYESRFAHNHILQVMSDMGMLGLAGFLALLLGSAWLAFRALRRDRDSMAALLLACWVMMNAHGLMEINFSIRAYQCAAFFLLLLPVVLYGRPLLKDKALKWGGWAVMGCIWLYLAVFGGLLLSSRAAQRDAQAFSTTSVRGMMDMLESLVRREPFDDEMDQLTFVGNAVMMQDPLYNGTMWNYVEELRASGTYTACSSLARYYYLPRGEYEELFACSREGIAQEASSKDAWNYELDFYRTELLSAMEAEDAKVYVDGVLALGGYLAAYSEGRLEQIALTEENQQFLNMVTSAQEEGISAEAIYQMLLVTYAGTKEPAA